jgi:hypothetical protein
MLEDMAVRKFGEKTRRDYIRHVETFASFLGRSPDTATADDVRRFQVHLTDSGAQPPKLNGSASALRFFFGTTLDRPSSPTAWPVCTTRASCRACSARRRLAVFSKRHPGRASSTRQP